MTVDVLSFQVRRQLQAMLKVSTSVCAADSTRCCDALSAVHGRPQGAKEVLAPPPEFEKDAVPVKYPIIFASAFGAHNKQP